MPLYEYKCARCGEVFETLQKFSDPPLKVHPACGGVVERLLSAPAFQFKGSGWYITDYARKNGSAAESHSNGKNGHETASTKTESKTPSTSESKTSESKTSESKTKS